jgi:hypothetical protein
LKYNDEQEKAIEDMELIITHLNFDGSYQLAKIWNNILQNFYDGFPVMAIIHAEDSGIDTNTVAVLRRIFKVLPLR